MSAVEEPVVAEVAEPQEAVPSAPATSETNGGNEEQPSTEQEMFQHPYYPPPGYYYPPEAYSDPRAFQNAYATPDGKRATPYPYPYPPDFRPIPIIAPVTPDMMGASPKVKTSEKRAQQNREAQRAFRLRKSMYIKDLESKAERLNELEREAAELARQNKKLKKAFEIMKLQVSHYKGASGSNDQENIEDNVVTQKKSNEKDDVVMFNPIESLDDVSSDDE